MSRPVSATLRFAYALQKGLWRLVRPRTRGVKVMLFNAERELLLIRNSYGRSDLLVLPVEFGRLNLRQRRRVRPRGDFGPGGGRRDRRESIYLPG